MSGQDDKAFARELRLASRVSRAYRQLGAPQPPPELDENIARHARAVLPPARNAMRDIGKPVSTRPSWFAPFTLAASVLLSAALLMAIAIRPAQRGGEAPVRLMRAVATHEDRAQLHYAAPAAASSTEGARESSPYVAPLIPSRRLYSTDPPGSHRPVAPALPPVPVQVIRRDPREWQAHIEQLERDGRDAEATAERRAFHQVYPDWR
ncbi:MAG: hypothetical protein JSS24_00485 [Proteobacteria bacterium]|nr:hypothetical protein [Pseudomonadota bacterium]